MKTSRPPCKYPECNKVSRSKGLCSQHGNRIRIRCNQPGCNKQSRGKEGRCYKHRLSSTTVVQKQIRRHCNIDKCTSIARGKHGLCAKHYGLINNASLSSTLNDRNTTALPAITIIDNQIESLHYKKQQLDNTLDHFKAKKAKLLMEGGGLAGTSVNTTLETGEVDHVVEGAVEELKGNEEKSTTEGDLAPTEEVLQPPIATLNTGKTNDVSAIIIYILELYPLTILILLHYL
jgi:hypothetical protein